MNKLVMLLMCLFAVSCTKEQPKPNPFKDIACSIGQAVGTAVSLEIQKQLDCKNLSAIQASVYDGLVMIKVCEKKEKSLLSVESTANPICASLANVFLNVVLEKGIPSAWQCSGGLAKDKIVEVINKACAKI